MFTVKATYRSEIRKFTFPISSFPTFSQINDQLCRVLPISTSYYLGRLLFVQSQSAPFARILIGMEAHSEEEYEQHVRPFRGRDWPGGLLRFTVYDEESPRETPSDVSTQQDDQDILMGDSYSLDGDHRPPRRHGHHEHRHIHGHHHGHHRGHQRRGDLPQWACPHPSFIAPPPPPLPPLPPPPPPPPLPFFPPFFHVPSPPLPPSRHGSPFIVPPLPILSPHVAHPAPPLPSLPPIQPLSQNYTRQQSPSPPVDGTETPVQKLFRRRGLRSVASAPLLAPSLPVPPPPPPPPPPRPVSLYGEVQIADSPVMRPNRRAATVSDEVDEFEVQALAEQVGDKGMQRDTCCDVERGKQDISDIIRTFKTDIDRVLSQSLHMEPTEVWGFSSMERQPSSTTPLSPSNSDRTVATNQNQSPEPTRAAEAPSDAEPVIHANVLCDNCQEVIIGVRHKCLDCPDFDLCSSCLATQPQNIGLHSRSHSLFAIEEPGGVWVHTVFTGDGNQDVPEPLATNGEPAEPPKTTPESQEESTTPTAEVALSVHHASCDLCDSAIKGDRYKCFDCPDFDTCASCYAIVPIQHPHHSFARLRDPQDLKYPPFSPPIHGANCNDCGKTIFGVRYKCMHPACSDFDLCATCEALPIPVHPITHAMLKIREPGAYVPVVKRYGNQRVPTPVASACGTYRAHDDDIAQNTEGRAHIGTNVDVATMPGQYAPVESDALPTPFPSNAHLSRASPKPTVELVDVSYPGFEMDTYEESTKKPVPFAFGAPVVIHDNADPSQPGHHVSTAAPLLPVPSPPPALATDFIRAVPSLHQNSQYTQDLITGLHGSDTRFAPWWGQSAWVPPTPPAPLPVPLRTPSTPRRSRSPELLVHFEEQRDTVQASADTLAATTALRSESDSGRTPDSLPHVPPMDFNELFDLTSQFRHLLELPPVITPPSMPAIPEVKPPGSKAESTTVDEVNVSMELASTQVDDVETPLSLVALLSKPEKTPRPGALDTISPGRLLSQLLDSSSTGSLSSPVDKSNKVGEDMPLRASFVADNNIPDGQIFPPGAEFVKSWRMRNDGPGSWPADTELVFVAGDKLVIDKSERFKVGGVPPGEEVDVWTGEMKAPDVPGTYISYWRLCDNKGRRFGHSIWIDICVTEPAKAPMPEEGDGSLASSSVVMPHSAPSNPTAPLPSHDESTTAPVLSDTSSMSLIDVLSDDEDEDSEVYEDSRSHFGSTPGNGQVLSPDVEYVVLSDGSDEL